MSLDTIESLLVCGKWMEADLATADYLFSLMGQRSTVWLTTDDIDRISCEHLSELNQVWLEYSNRRFGFTVQESIYRKFKDKYTSIPYTGLKSFISQILEGSSDKLNGFQIIQVLCWFDAEVGWLTYNPNNIVGYDSYLTYDQITFDLTAPKGHLPCEALWRIRHQCNFTPFELLFKKYGVLGLNGCLAKYSYEIEDRFFNRIGICCKQSTGKNRVKKVEQLNLFDALNNPSEE